MPIELVMPSNHLILCCPLLLPSVFPSIRIFSNELALHTRWPKYWSFSLIISPSNEYSGLISFMIDWFDLLTIQGVLKSLLQHHSSKASMLFSFYLWGFFFIFLIFNWWLVYNIGLISVIHQHELTIGVHMSLPSWIALPPLTHSHPSSYHRAPVWVI